MDPCGYKLETPSILQRIDNSSLLDNSFTYSGELYVLNNIKEFGSNYRTLYDLRSYFTNL